MSARPLAAAWLIFVAGAALADPVQGTALWTQTLTQQALTSGFLTRLPPAVSTALGLPKADQGTEVRQLLRKSGPHVRTFNVSVANHEALVIFNVDARSGETVAYLLAPDGSLRRAVSYPAGGAASALDAAQGRAGLAREVRFWSARARRVLN
jgi:hypothetical protein